MALTLNSEAWDSQSCSALAWKGSGVFGFRWVIPLLLLLHAAVWLHWVCMKDALFFLPLDKDKAESDSSQRTLVPEDNESRSMVGGLIKVQKHLAETANTLQGNLTYLGDT